MKLILFVFLVIASMGEGRFVPPSEGPLPFRIDKLPIDVDTMEMLSSQLLLLAGASNTEDPAGARRTAQILALSLALNPVDRESLEMIKRLERNEPVGTGDAKLVSQAKSRTWHLMGWLEQPEAGADGNALAACLADVLAGVDPEHPRASALAGKAERGKWIGWVAAVDDFKETAATAAIEEPMLEQPTSTTPVVPLKLRSASLEIPLWYLEKDIKEPILRPVSVMMEARIDGDSKDLQVNYPSQELGDAFGQTNKNLQGFLEDRYDEIPPGLHYTFKIANDIPYSEKRNGRVFLGAMFVLADAALGGVAPEGIVFAEPNGDGSLKPPARFWQTIRMFADYQEGSRLILPTAAKDFMPPLITLDQSSFFLNFEVLMADSIVELCERASSAPPEDLEEAHEIFESVRQARGSRSLGSFLSHDSTQQRLRQAISLFPDHISARMLALRGTSQWPTRLSREIFAREIRAVIEPFGSFFRPGRWNEINGEEMEATIDEGREKLASAEKLYGSVGDRQELHSPALNVTKSIGSLAVDVKRSSDRDGTRRDHLASYSKAWAEYIEVIELLTAAAGDALDYPVPQAQPKP